MPTVEGQTAVYDLEMAIKHLSYDDMINFADFVAHESGVLVDLAPAEGLSQTTIEDFARAIRGYASILEGVRTTR